MFENVTSRPEDPIDIIARAFKADDNPNKVDLGVGVYRDDIRCVAGDAGCHRGRKENRGTGKLEGIPDTGRQPALLRVDRTAAVR